MPSDHGPALLTPRRRAAPPCPGSRCGFPAQTAGPRTGFLSRLASSGPQGAPAQPPQHRQTLTLPRVTAFPAAAPLNPTSTERCQQQRPQARRGGRAPESCSARPTEAGATPAGADARVEVVESCQISLETSLLPSALLTSFAELPAGLGIPRGRAPRARGGLQLEGEQQSPKARAHTKLRGLLSACPPLCWEGRGIAAASCSWELLWSRERAPVGRKEVAQGRDPSPGRFLLPPCISLCTAAAAVQAKRPLPAHICSVHNPHVPPLVGKQPEKRTKTIITSQYPPSALVIC